ncbi:uncharacterized protein LOC116002770 isoform X2 [Ipomoea triloba]|uniref:uncharacterized protein LOC116002770 isoform X2 n=1 Tax=Ipomoea triloba TaxID=35885 RepID=UPI00125DD9B0|nr:uncharacterized protein LOC116002770 isoform X2 [Ipomoea triloba]
MMMLHGTSQFPGPRIIKHKDDKAVYQTRRDPDLMNKIKGIQMLPEQIMSESPPDLEGQDEWKGNPNGTSSDHQNATEEIKREDEKMIKDYYRIKIGEVVKEAKSVYDGPNIDEMRESRFIYMMINHGCLFLLQMFVFLGLGVNQLKDLSGLSGPDLDILFGSDHKDIETRKNRFTKSAVFPGNQIPLLVLKKLIDSSSFFKKVVLEENWEKPSSSSSSSPDLVLKSVLYDLILGPVLKTHTQEATTDILHGLHSRLVGKHGNEALALIDSKTNNLDTQTDNQRIPMSSVTEMYSKGMHFKGVSGMAITEIKIKGSVFTKKVLHLPVFTFNEMTKYLYKCLKGYENDQGQSEKVVNYYLQFLRDIVQRDQDVLLLRQKGVIQVQVQNDDHEVVEYLGEVATDDATLTTHHFRTVKLAITHHHLKPWYYKYLTGPLFSITLSIISLTFSILAYFSRKT